MISWWCTALERPWTWEWIPYPGVWLAALIPSVAYIRAVRRHSQGVDRTRMFRFVAAIVLFWIASDWPLGTLGAGYLASAHMVQFLLYTLGVAPLLLLGTPEWLARRIASKLRIERLTTRLGNSLVVSGAIYNLMLIATHAPGTVDVLRRSQFGSFAMDVAWIVAGMVLWLPVLSPLPEGRHPSMWLKMGYLFVTTSVIAVIPASFLTFASTPIYAIYELAPRIGTLTAQEDQQLAGIIMKLATIPVIWGTIAVLWFRWTRQEASLA